MKRLINNLENPKRTETDADLDIETYESIELDGKFRVYYFDEERAAVTVDGWNLLKRRILVNSMRLTDIHEFYKLFRVNNVYAYKFTDGIHITGIPDGMLKSVMMFVDYGSLYETKPIQFSVWLK